MQDELNKHFVEKWLEIEHPNLPPMPIQNLAQEFAEKVQALLPSMEVEIKLVFHELEWTWRQQE